MEYRKHLEEKFRKYQAILADCAEEEDSINLEEITRDFCEVDEWGRISIRHIPKNENSVFLTVCPENKKEKPMDIIIPLCQVSDDSLYLVVENMRKAMIIEELRNTYQS